MSNKDNKNSLNYNMEERFLIMFLKKTFIKTILVAIST